MTRDPNVMLSDLAAASERIATSRTARRMVDQLCKATDQSAQKLALAIDSLPTLVAEIVEHTVVDNTNRCLSATVGGLLSSTPDGTVVLGLGSASHPFEYRLYNDQIEGRPAGSGHKEWHVQASLSRDLRQRGIVMPSKFADLLLVAPAGMVIEVNAGQGPGDWWQASRGKGFRWWSTAERLPGWSPWNEYEAIPFGTSIGDAGARAIFDVDNAADASPTTRGPIEVIS